MSEWDEWKREHAIPKPTKSKEHNLNEVIERDTIPYQPFTDEEREMVKVLAKCRLGSWHEKFVEMMGVAKQRTARQAFMLAGVYYAYRGQHKKPATKPDGWR